MTCETRRTSYAAKKTVFEPMVELATKDGVTPISSLPGCWERQIDDQWKIISNGHAHPVDYENTPIPPYHTLIEYNGFPAGVLTPHDGTIVSGTEANEDNLIRALEKAIAEVTPCEHAG